MKNLFYIKDHALVIDEMAYGIKQYRELIDRDKSEGKEIAIAEFNYMYHMCDPRSDFYEEKNDSVRHEEVRKNVYGLPAKWKPDAKVKAAMELYVSKQSVFVKLLNSAEVAVNNTSKYLESVDLFELDEKGKQAHDVNKLVAAVEKLPKLIKSLSEAKKAVDKELEKSTGVRGSVDKGLFEDGFE